jgi:hypothetical protein
MVLIKFIPRTVLIKFNGMSATHLGLSTIMQTTYLPSLVSWLLPLIRVSGLQYYNILDDSLITISP